MLLKVDEMVLLRVGRIVLEGNIDIFKTSDVIKEAYLGK